MGCAILLLFYLLTKSQVSRKYIHVIRLKTLDAFLKPLGYPVQTSVITVIAKTVMQKLIWLKKVCSVCIRNEFPLIDIFLCQCLFTFHKCKMKKASGYIFFLWKTVYVFSRYFGYNHWAKFFFVFFL